MAHSRDDSNNDQPVAADSILIRGARVHNLCNIDLDIPRDQLVVITGLSGSGKSSLAFDTVYAEGQRQYIESLSVYARQFLNQMQRPDVDLIEGLQPTIAVDQRAGGRNPRSTVATVTEIYDHLRLLYARVGQPHCHRCRAAIVQQTPEQIVDDLLALPEGTKTIILAPFIRGRKGQHKEVFEAIRKAGFVRARVDDQVHDIDEIPTLARQKNHTIEAVVDRVLIRDEIRARIAESINLAVKYGEGVVAVSIFDTEGSPDGGVWREKVYSTLYACPACKISYEELEPRTFSFNSPYGACPTCEGLGTRVEFDPDLMLSDRGLSLATGAVVPWKGATAAVTRRRKTTLGEFFSSAGVAWDTPIEDYTPKAMEKFLHGTGKEFPGLLIMLEKELATATRASRRTRLESFRGEVTCRDCDGARLRPEARFVLIAEEPIHRVTAMTVEESRQFFGQLDFDEDDTPVGKPIVREIKTRLDFLDKVGLGYLTLNRAADTLSGGEAQRVRLASGLGSGLVGVCYVLDEPSIGLHQRDNGRLIGALRDLQAAGNSVLVVEHDEAMIRQADYLIDLGPGAGRHGGQIVAKGSVDVVSADRQSITGAYLRGQRQIATPARRRKISLKRSLVIEGVTTNNLKNVTAAFPTSALICVTGVSGSGKSSLLNETLALAIARKLNGTGPKPGPHKSLRGTALIDKLVEIDQSPIGRTPRSNPATYSGVFDEVRKVFTNTREARLRGYKAGRFSFNVKGGRCDGCQGQGVQKIEMNFLPDLYVKCPDCEGARFNHQTLQARYRGRSIADVLAMPIDDALEFFDNFPVICRLLGCLQQVGLGYLQLGQASTTLSGGEAQRVKLASELARVDTGRSLYILDEPTTGLHLADIEKLLEVLNRLVDLGNTVIIIEHHLDVIKTADWIIDLGPEGGQRGGQIMATGTPEQIAQTKDNPTGSYLAPLLNGLMDG